MTVAGASHLRTCATLSRPLKTSRVRALGTTIAAYACTYLTQRTLFVRNAASTAIISGSGPTEARQLLVDLSITRYLVSSTVHMAYMQQPQQLVLVDPRYCIPQEVVLVMQENVGFKTDNFRITDTNGTPWFK